MVEGTPESGPDGIDEGRPLDGATRRRLESWFSRDLRDVRIHDTGQAERLAGRLGAEAFAIGSHIFGRTGSLSEPNPGRSALLAHEVTHVIQQTRSQPALAHLPPHHSGLRGSSIDRQELAGDYASTGINQNWLSLTAESDPLQRSAESEARQNEEIVRGAADSRQWSEGVPEGVKDAAMPDPVDVADRVYRMMMTDLVIDRERGARHS